MGTTIRTTAQSARARWRAWMARRSRVGRLTIRLILISVIAQVLRAAGFLNVLCLVVIVLCWTVLSPLLIVLIYRWITHRLLWKVRNRLIVTYLLLGLSPVILFGTLGGIAAYFLTGQYATNAAISILDEASGKVRDETASEAAFSVSTPGGTAPSKSGSLTKAGRPTALTDSQISVAVLDGGTWRPLFASAASGAETAPLLSVPSPSLQLPFHGIVEFQGRLYLCSEASVPMGNRSMLVMGSRPLDSQQMTGLAHGLGKITVDPGFSRITNAAMDDDDDSDSKPTPTPDSKQHRPTVVVGGKPKLQVTPNHDFDRVEGGKLAPRTHFFDAPVFFSAPLTITSWDTGKTSSAVLAVTSRPTLLYARLFANSVTAGTVVKIVLASITFFFALLEFFALLMAIGLSRTITRSVSDLYRGTKEIDAGNLAHRVRVAKHDQLGDLASSFNGMAASVSSLLVQQREQQRLLNELAIAQEVQTTLFPSSPALLGGLEMHALCLPARTVGGDYFDFIFGSHSGLCLALGDISGKGISAALLMASLHSAVRAFSLGQDDVEGELPSPAMLLKLLNRHLYLSTQSARYATLFLAFYDPKTRRLTYSNGGHLPPLLLAADGTVRRLDCGGSVVGLLEELDYEQATVQLETGDLLIAFTDGLTEPENGANDLGEEFGEARLLSLMQQHREEPLPMIAAGVLQTLQAWIGGKEQPDDMTILLARQI